MITLKQVHDTINALRAAAARLHKSASDECGVEFGGDGQDVHGNRIFPPVDSGPVFYADMWTEERKQCSELAMAWHDLARGCHSDLDLQIRIAEQSTDARVRLFAADRSEAAE